MKTSGVTIIKDKDAVVADPYLSIALEHNKSFFGSAYAENGVVSVTKKRVGVTLEAFNAVQNNADFKAKDIVFFLGSSETPMGKEHDRDIQPYKILQNAEGKTILVAFLDGKFENFVDDTVDKSHATACVEAYLRPRFQNLFDLCGGDITKFMAQLDKDTTIGQDMATAMDGERGSITLFAGDGSVKVFTVADDPTQNVFDGFFTTNDYGYKGESLTGAAPEKKDDDDVVDDDQPIIPLKVAPPAPKPGLGAPAAKVAPPAPKAALVAPPAPKSGKPASATPLATTASMKPGAEKVQLQQVPDKSAPVQETEILTIPGHLHGKPKKKWIKHKTQGFLPDDWQTIKTLEVKRTIVKSMAELPKPAGDTAPVTITKPVVAAPAPKAAGVTPVTSKVAPPAKKHPEGGTAVAKDTTVHNTQTPGPAHTVDPGIAETEAIPLIPADQRETIVNALDTPEIKGLIDNHSAVINDPAAYEAYEKRVPSFAQQLAPALAGMEDTLRWPYEVVRDLARACPDAVAVLWHSTRSEMARAKKQNRMLSDQLDGHLHDKIDTTGKALTEPGPVEQAAAPAAKKNLFAPPAKKQAAA